MSDLLKEAIADAKAVRETALQNAKMALEEAFTPQLKSMLSAKLKEDEMDDEESAMEDEMGDDDEVPAEEAYEDEHMGDEEPSETYEDEMGGDDEEPAMEDEMGDDEDMEEEGLDLEAVIRELETELKEEDDAYDEKAAPKKDGLAEAEDDEDEDKVDEDVEIDDSIFTEGEDEDDEDKVDEQSKSSEIGKGDNKVDYADSADEEDPGKGQMHEELKEYKEAVKFLKNKLHEVNILNAKLLFTNKLFKAYSLNNNQKLKVVETFDRAQTTREIKLVYSTLAEQFGDNGSIARKKSINESASSAVSSTKPSKESRKVISEETQVANRFKKLAGLIK